MKKSITLVELLVAGVLVSLVVMAAFTLDNTARSFYRSSKRKSELVNEMMFVVNHIQKNVSRRAGYLGDTTASVVANNQLIMSIDRNNTPTDLSDDFLIRYFYDANNNAVDFCDDWDSNLGNCNTNTQTLVTGIIVNTAVDPVFSNLKSLGSQTPAFDIGVSINLMGLYNTGPNAPTSQRDNPSAELKTAVFFEEYSAS